MDDKGDNIAACVCVTWQAEARVEKKIKLIGTVKVVGFGRRLAAYFDCIVASRLGHGHRENQVCPGIDDSGLRFARRLSDMSWQSSDCLHSSFRTSNLRAISSGLRLQFRRAGQRNSCGRYYELNLDQNSRIFFLGVLCIVLGAGVIGVTMYFLYNPAHDAGASQPSDKYVLGLVGVIGSLLTNYVAAIFLKMHAAVTTSLVDLHAKLVHTHELFLANLLAARIQVDQQRQEAFAKLALAIVGYKEQ